MTYYYYFLFYNTYSSTLSLSAASQGKDLMWAAHRGRGWHSLEHRGCWQRWRRCSPLRRLPRGPGRLPLRTDCPRNPGPGRSGGVAAEVEGTRRKVAVRVPPDRQHYPESPVGRERDMGEKGVKAKVAAWRTSTVSFTESITRPHRDHFPKSFSLKVIQAWILYFHFPMYVCVRTCAHTSTPPHPLNIHCSHIYY